MMDPGIDDKPGPGVLIDEDQRDSAFTTSTQSKPSDDEVEDHMREEYNAGDKAAKRPRLGPKPADDAITNHANGNRVNLSEYPTIHERSIPSDVAFVTKLESVNDDEQSGLSGFSNALRQSGGRLAIKAQVGMGKTTALEITLREMMGPEVESMVRYVRAD